MNKYIFFPYREFTPERNNLRFPLVIFLPKFIRIFLAIIICIAFILLLFSIINLFFYWAIAIVSLLIVFVLMLQNRIPVGTMFFLSPTDIKKGSYELQMGFFAFFIYNRISIKRRHFIINEVNNILEASITDPRINMITTVTWLLEPFPKDIPPANCEPTPIYRNYMSSIIILIISIIATKHFNKNQKLKITNSFSLKKPLLEYSWDKETLQKWYK